MAERDDSRRLGGVAVAQDAVLGAPRSGKPGRGSENKVPCLAVSLSDDGRPLKVRFDPIPDLKGASVRRWAERALDPQTHLVTGALASLADASAVVAHCGAILVSPHQPHERSPVPGSMGSSPTTKPRSAVPTTTSGSASTPAATACAPWSGVSCTPTGTPRPAVKTASAKRRCGLAEAWC